MDHRTEGLLKLRPIITTALLNDNMSEEERFQNATLRPVLKLQNELLFDVFKNYAAKHKNMFYDLSLAKKIDYIDSAVHKDIKFRNSIKGMIIGQFTIEEYADYTKNSSALNKRMMNMVKERIISYIQLLRPEMAKVI